MYPDPADFMDEHDDMIIQSESEQPIALLPQRCPKFQVGDEAMRMHSEVGATQRITATRFETAYPAIWWYQLDGSRRWYPEGHLWNHTEWHEYQVQTSIYKLRWEQQAQARLNPPKPPQWREYVTALTNPEFNWQVRNYCKAFIEHVDYYYGSWNPPLELRKEYLSCLGIKE
jgi:hypothetical protein